MSVVYVKDIVKAIVWLIGPENGDRVINRPINIAGYEQITFKEMMRDIGAQIGVMQELTYTLVNHTDLPSITKGPVDLSLAREKMDWLRLSTSWPIVVQEVADFYEHAMTQSSYAGGPREQVLTKVSPCCASGGYPLDLKVSSCVMVLQVFNYAKTHSKEVEVARAIEEVYGLSNLVEQFLGGQTTGGDEL